jgi:hypothetical protein
MSGDRRLDVIVVGFLALSFISCTALQWLNGSMTATIAATCAAAIFLIFYLLLVPDILRRTILQSFLVLAPLLVVVILVVWAVLLPKGVEDPAAQPALIAGTIVAAGWLVTYLVSEYREEKAIDVRRKDALHAIRSEIFSVVDKLDNQPIEEHAQEVQSKILSGEGHGKGGRPNAYYPFSTMESEPIAFAAIASAIPSLKPDTVDSVLRFYAEYADLRRLVEDSRTELARALPPVRRVALHKELTKRRAGTLRWGINAYVAINRDLGVRNPDDVRRSGKNPNI